MTTIEAEGRTALNVAHTLNVPAIRGVMGSTQYFTANFPMGMVVRLFTYDPAKMLQLPVEQRHQRALKPNRIPEIAEYMQEKDYFFSSLTVSVDAEWLEFVPSELDDNVGVLKLPMETEWIINDGQHRVAGIAEALSRNPSLRNDNISVIVVADAGLERTQQIFSDLNRTVLKTSRSLDILFDHRSPINRIATYVVDNCKLFTGRTDKERTSLSAQSPMFATLNGVQQATRNLFAYVDDADLAANYEHYEKLAVDFWNKMTALVGPWAAVASGALTPMEARGEYVASYQMVIAAVGQVGGEALEAYPKDWEKHLKPLHDIDWRKEAHEWQFLIMIGDEVVTRVTTRKALAEYLRWRLGFIKDKPKLPLRGKGLAKNQRTKAA